MIGCLLISILVAPQAFAVSNGAWAIEPSGPDGEELLDRGFFFYELAPGQSVTDWVSVANASDQPMSFNIYGADAYNLDDGTWALTTYGSPVEDVGAWLAFGESSVTVEPGTELRMQFTITAPDDISPGDYAGGVVTINQEVEGIDSEAGTALGLQRAIGVRTFVRITGPVRPALAVVDVSTGLKNWFSADGGDVTVTYTVKNVGNMRLSPQVVVSADGLLSDEYFRADPVEIPILLPGQEATLSHTWTDLPYLDLVRFDVVANHEKVVAAASTDRILISPVALGVFTAMLLLISLLVVRRRRKRKHDEMAPPPVPEKVGAAA